MDTNIYKNRNVSKAPIANKTKKKIFNFLCTNTYMKFLFLANCHSLLFRNLFKTK